MNVIVVYESMFGNTRLIAEAISRGLQVRHGVSLLRVGEAPAVLDSSVDALVVGAPTHAQGLSTLDTRIEATAWAADPERELVLEPRTELRGVREWLAALPALPPYCTAFDTRADALRVFTGAASSAISRQLRRRGTRPLLRPQSFIVTKINRLKPDEVVRAENWAEELGNVLPGEPGAQADTFA
jgi:hypothetical protein